MLSVRLAVIYVGVLNIFWLEIDITTTKYILNYFFI